MACPRQACEQFSTQNSWPPPPPQCAHHPGDGTAPFQASLRKAYTTAPAQDHSGTGRRTRPPSAPRPAGPDCGGALFAAQRPRGPIYLRAPRPRRAPRRSQQPEVTEMGACCDERVWERLGQNGPHANGGGNDQRAHRHLPCVGRLEPPLHGSRWRGEKQTTSRTLLVRQSHEHRDAIAIGRLYHHKCAHLWWYLLAFLIASR